MKSTIPNLCIKTSKGRQYYVTQVTIDGKRIDRRLGLNTPVSEPTSSTANPR